MKIGIDCRMYRKETAGIGRYTRNLIKNLLKIDKENQYVLFMTGKDLDEFEEKAPNIKVVPIDIPHYTLAEQTGLIRYLDNEKLDLMHFTNFNHPLRYRGKFIVTIHDLTMLYYPETAKVSNIFKRFALNKVMASAIRKSEMIITPSEATKKDVLKFQKVDVNKIKVIYEAADDRSHSEQGEESVANATSGIRQRSFTGVQDDKSIILYVGQFREHKNIKKLLEAYKILKNEMPVQLVLIGKVSDDIQKYIDINPEMRDTLVPGFVSDEELLAWYNVANVFVFPSLYEGFGLPGLEAMQVGLPVVASNRSSLPEIYGEAALYFDPLNPNDIAGKIRIAISDKSVSEKLISKGKIQVKKYSWKKCAEETLKIFKEIQRSKLK